MYGCFSRQNVHIKSHLQATVILRIPIFWDVKLHHQVVPDISKEHSLPPQVLHGLDSPLT